MPLPLLLFALFFISPSSALTSDGLSLLALKAAVTTDPTKVLDSWSEDDASPCRWNGVLCTGDRVTAVVLAGNSLTGYIPSELGRLESLQRLDLSRNNFSKPVPSHLFAAAMLTSLDLAGNSFSGTVPDQIGTLKNLTHLDLSSNRFNGSLPEVLAELHSLAGTLNLSFNLFSGGVPEAYGHFPVMVSLDLRHNNLSGKIPLVGTLLNQGPTAFSGNPSLCGFPVANPCRESQDPIAIPHPEHPHASTAAAYGTGTKHAPSLAVPLLSATLAVVSIASVSAWLLRRKVGARKVKGENDKAAEEDNQLPADEEVQEGKFVVFDDTFNLELEDLLRASAYVVGKSRSGIVYKVVVVGRGVAAPADPATVLAVRRLSEGDSRWRFREFEAEMEAMGRLNHPNVVSLKAYYFASDEKLLISDFVRRGSLHSALHGDTSKTAKLLTWEARLKIAQGVARGLAYIHEHSPRKYVHGSIKSTKILLSDDNHPYVSGFGLTRLVPGSSTGLWSKKQTVSSSGLELKISLAPSNSYLAPEAHVPGVKLTQKSDVYSFGVVLMEILTGRVPDLDSEGKGLESLVRKVFREERPLSEIIDASLLGEVHAKKQVIAAFHIALNCTEINPELRPRMRIVSENLDRIELV